MHNIEIIIILLSGITLLNVLAERIRIPYPILLVLVGLGIGMIPGLPDVTLNPDVVFLIFLPPLLYEAAWTTSWHDFKEARRPISMLAVGLVFFTTAAVAWGAYTLIPEFTWAEAFVLGAIVSPPDAVAANAITKRLGVPRRIVTILEGESLVNDASGLIAYRYAVAAVTTGSFIWWEAGIQFVLVSIAGIALGLLVGRILLFIHTHTPDNSTVDTSLTLLTPYIAFLVAEQFHFSGVLAVVSSGLYLSWKSSEMFSHSTRIKAISVWETVVFLLNGVIFILIGLQLPSILKGIHHFSLGTLVLYGFVISLIVMLVRIMWVYPGAYVPRWMSRSIREQEADPGWRRIFIVAWTGMRGVVSLAAALALPVMMQNNQEFPNRNLILFLTFCVILFTLVFQGLTLPLIIRWFNIKSDHNLRLEEIEARKKLLGAVIVHIEENLSYGVLSEEALAQIKNKYEIRYNHLRNFSTISGENPLESLFHQFQQTEHELVQLERKLLIQMKKEGKIGDDILRKLEFELDLEESRLVMEREQI